MEDLRTNPILTLLRTEGLFIANLYTHKVHLQQYIQGMYVNPKQFPGPNPLSLALVMDLPASKSLRTGPYKA
jgi:hypothetical protein